MQQTTQETPPNRRLKLADVATVSTHRIHRRFLEFKTRTRQQLQKSTHRNNLSTLASTMLRHCLRRTLSMERVRKLSIVTTDTMSLEESPTAILLIPEDYPRSFRGDDGGKRYAHKDDYKVTTTPIKPHVFLYRGSGGSRVRLFFRTSIKLNNDPSNLTFTTATFILDTGCCPHMNLSDELTELLADRIIEDDGREFYISTHIKEVKHQCIVKSDLPDQHKTANVMGLPMFFALGIAFPEGSLFSLKIDKEKVAYDAATISSGFEYL